MPSPSASDRDRTLPHLPTPGIGHFSDHSDNGISIDEFSDEDAEFSTDLADDVVSLSSSVLDYEYENGRRYHSNRMVSPPFPGRRAQVSPAEIPTWSQGEYMLPNDEEEQDRMDLKTPQEILDLGTGTGIWALDMAEKFPSAHITATDIDPIQPSWTLPNLEFIVENFEDEWLYKKNHFDYIHARLLAMCVADWPLLIRRMYEHTKPGGYCEHQESAIWAWSDDGSLTADSPIFQHVQALDTAARLTGRELNMWYKIRGWMIDAGFEDVKESVYFLPYSPWPRDPHLKELGRYQAVMAQQAVESYGLRLCTQVLGWGVEPARIFQAMVKQQLRDKHLHAYLKVVTVHGRKPRGDWS
ncbi:hypothetical protein N7492_005353 [Penicillium capsulatum]|uniref:S-adenosyl-L-methionine-dependent methyltransferase n=1 Tax=Penicillium capsulatum TaxID=69766 RepID=A0A9W9IC36_9EURO|nr:hypothetical protein N7492_005353 [Penicillium capsulatum]